MTPDEKAMRAIRTLQTVGLENIPLPVLREFYIAVHRMVFKNAYSHINFEKVGFSDLEILNMYKNASKIILEESRADQLKFVEEVQKNKFYEPLHEEETRKLKRQDDV